MGCDVCGRWGVMCAGDLQAQLTAASEEAEGERLSMHQVWEGSREVAASLAGCNTSRNITALSRAAAALNFRVACPLDTA